jgi:hypothetical protein
MYLEESSAPFSNSLLQKVRAAQQQVAAGQMPSQQQIADMASEVPQSSNGSLEQLQQMLYSQMI